MTAANQALKTNRDPEAAEWLNTAASEAQAWFDQVAADEFIANMFYERLLDQMKEDRQVRKDRAREAADEERWARENAMYDAQTTYEYA